jgi:Polyketide cyclase / dehydrase and lipid transport
MTASVSTTVTTIVDAPVDTAFDYIVPVDLRTIFKGYRLLPGVKHTSITDGWTKPGLTRTVTLTDGSSSTETLLTVVPHQSFSYKNENFTAAFLRLLMIRMEGYWVFTALDAQRTQISWTYTLVPKHALAKLIIRAVVLRMIHGMLDQALHIIKGQLAAQT